MFVEQPNLSLSDGSVLVDERGRMSWGELTNKVRRGANALLALTDGQPQRVAVFARNSSETALAYIAALRAGLSSVPVNFHLTVDEAAYIFQDSGAEVLFVGPENAAVGLEAARRVGIQHVIGWRTSMAGVVSFESWLDAASDAEPPSHMPALPHLHYTSGTTGKPKGVETPPNMFPEGATVAEAFAVFAKEARTTAGGVNLAISPLYHTSPLRAVRALAGGAPLVSTDKFEAERMLQLVEEYKISAINMTPTHFVRLLALPEEVRARYDLSSLTRIRHTGAPCPVHVKRAMIEWLGPIIIEVYGATESGPTTSISSEEWLKHPGSVGRCIPPFEVEVRSEQGEVLPQGEVGVLYFRDKTGRGIRYLNDAQKSANAHIAPGVFTLGEMGYVNAEGYVYLTDRISDMIVSGGVNIYPVEIEHVLMEHPGVQDVAVIGVPHEEMSEEVMALVVAREDRNAPSREELDALCRSRLAGYKRPRHYAFVDDVGRNALGKVNKKALREAALSIRQA